MNKQNVSMLQYIFFVDSMEMETKKMGFILHLLKKIALSL